LYHNFSALNNRTYAVTRQAGGSPKGTRPLQGFHFLVVVAGFADNHHQKRMILGGLAARQISLRRRPPQAGLEGLRPSKKSFFRLCGATSSPPNPHHVTRVNRGLHIHSICSQNMAL